MSARHKPFQGSASGLLTDLYELTMAAGYTQTSFEAQATFELFVRNLPPHRNYLVAAGLDQALEFLERVHFSADEISWLRALPLFRHVQTDFFDYLRHFHFSGDVWALPEGTIFFPGEPLLRVTAPIAEAQLMETSLLSAIHLQTLVASKAARVTKAAGERPVVEFGSRRAHGIEAAVLAARAAFIGGCSGTSNAYAGYRFDIPVFGTQAHSWIMAHDEERVAFENFLDVFPEQSTLLVDTYDVRTAIDRIIALGRKPAGLRLDSGDLLADSLWARERLDHVGWKDVRIFASGDLDENRIPALLEKGARIDSFGVGTALSTSSDSPSIGVIYKLVEVQFEDHVRCTAKFSSEKKTYPGRKQIFRSSTDNGVMSGDVIALEDEVCPGAEALLIQVMQHGRRLPPVSGDPAKLVKEARTRFLEQRACLPDSLLELTPATSPYSVCYSEHLEDLAERVRKSMVASPEAKTAGDPPERVSPRFLFWEVDMQNDFIQPDGALFIPDSPKIVPNVQSLVDAARQRRVLLLSEVDVHHLEDAELQEWPPHCMEGTPGGDIISEALASNRLVIPNEAGFEFPESFEGLQQIVIEKNTLDVFDNPNTELLLNRLNPEASPAFHQDAEFIVFGVATDYCVRKNVEGLLRRGRRVAIVTDAIAAIDRSAGQQVLANFRDRGVRMISTSEALALLNPNQGSNHRQHDATESSRSS